MLKNVKSKAELYEDTEKVIETLSKKYKIVITTNHPSEFLKIGLPLIDQRKIFKVYSSNDMGLSKKDEEFWKFILRDLNAKAEEIVHFGDKYDHDYISPMRVGIKSYYLKRSKISLLELIQIAGLV